MKRDVKNMQEITLVVMGNAVKYVVTKHSIKKKIDKDASKKNALDIIHNQQHLLQDLNVTLAVH